MFCLVQHYHSCRSMVDQAQWCRALNHHTRDPSSSPAHDRKTESDMDPGTLASKDLLAVIAQHESYFQLQKAVLSHQEALMTKHSQVFEPMCSNMWCVGFHPPALWTASPPPVSPPSGNRPTSVAEPRLPPPKPFAGDPNSCQGFLTCLSPSA